MTATEVMRGAVRSPSAVIIGALAGLIAVLWWPAIIETANRAVDTAFPVVSGDAATVARDHDAVIIAVTFRKHRDCRYERVQAYAKLAGDVKTAIYSERVDRPAESRSVPAGETYFAGRWKLWPIDGAYGVVMYAQHDCGGRQVSSLLAEVNL